MNKNTNVSKHKSKDKSKRKAKDKSKHKSKHKYDEFGNIITEKNTYIRGLIKRIPNIRNSIVLNKWFFSLIILIIIYWSYIETIKSNNLNFYKTTYITSITYILHFYWLFTCLIITAMWGWYAHYLSHHISCNDYLETLHIPKNGFLHFIATYVYDFHDIIHHNSAINKKWINLLIEFISNFWYEGIFYVFILWIFNLHHLIYIKIPLLWGLTYASSHCINYTILEPLCHVQHHKNPYTNFGLDTIDVIMNTKYDIDCLEDFNHTGFNMLVLFLLIEHLYP